MINQHRCWKWFLRVVKDNNTNLHERLVKGLYAITQEEKEKLETVFKVGSSFREILDQLDVI